MSHQQPPAKRKRQEDDDILTTPSKDRHALSKQAAAAAAAATQAPPDNVRRKNLLEISGTRERSSRDEIHGNVSMEPALTAIIDTPYFQRLRSVRQLGVSSYVYMNANHSRYEHSLGVAHLAQRQVESLREKQEALRITKKEVLLVKMAGLLHDMGHGPYSHTFEGHLKRHGMDHVKHEQLSLDQIDAVLASRGLQVDVNNLDKPLMEIATAHIGIKANTFGYIRNRFQEKHNLSPEDVITSRDIIFVKECILGEPLPGLADFIGRPESKEFLYDIVNNRHSGKDVDKDDYYVRDSARALGHGQMDMLLIHAARVTKIECQVKDCFRCRARRADSKLEPSVHLSLAYPKKYATTVIKFFDRRQDLHATIYTHKTAQSIEYMICDILAAAEPHYRIKLDDGRLFSISEATRDADAFLKLTDRIIDRIEDSDAEGLEEAKRLIKRLEWRHLYNCVWSCRLNEERQRELWEMKENEIHAEMMGIVEEYRNTAMDEEGDSPNQLVEIEEEEDDGDDVITTSIRKLKGTDFIVQIRVIHKGKKTENPMRYVPFYDTRQDERQLANDPFSLPMASQANEAEYATRNTKAYLDKTIRIFSRASEMDPSYDEKNEAIKACFQRWFERKGGDSNYPSLSQC